MAADLPDFKRDLVRWGLMHEYEEGKRIAKAQRTCADSQGQAATSWSPTSARPGNVPVAQTAPEFFPHPHPSITSGAAYVEWPTGSQFTFLYTVSYWIAIDFILGAIVLTFTSCTPLLQLMPFNHAEERLPKALRTKIAFGGDLLYTLGSFLQYLILINVHEGPMRIFVWDWAPIRAAHPQRASRLGVLAFLCAMIIWDIGAVAELFGELAEAVEISLVKIPSLLGACGFVLGSACEVYENKHKHEGDDNEHYFLKWLASVLDVVGSSCFFVSAVAGFFAGTALFCSLCLTLGMVIFFVTGVLRIKMWRGDDFGLTLLGRINDSLRTGRLSSINTIQHDSNGPTLLRVQGDHEEQEALREHAQEKGRKRTLSTRVVFFLVMYCWLLGITGMNLMASCYADEGFGKHFNDVLDSLLWIAIVLVVLILHSAVTHVPREQPYRLAYSITRFVLLVVAVYQTIIFVEWLSNPRHPEGLAPRGPAFD